MKKIKILLQLWCFLHSFGVFAADDASQVGMTRASDVEAGSKHRAGAPSTGQSMNDAFDVHKLVAGEWS